KLRNAEFEDLCMRYLYAKYSSSVRKEKSLPLSAFARNENSLFKISPSAGIEALIKEINNDGKKLGSKGFFKKVVYFNEKDFLSDSYVLKEIKKNIKHSLFSHNIITHSTIASFLASSNSLGSPL